MAQLTPLPLTVSCFSKIQIGFTFLVPAHPGSPGQRTVKRVYIGFKVLQWPSGYRARLPCEKTQVRISPPTVVFIAMANAICSLGHGLCTFTAVPGSTQPCIPPGSLPTFRCGKGGNVTCAGWQVTLCDSIRHVSSRSREASCELLNSIYLILPYVYRSNGSSSNVANGCCNINRVTVT